MDSSNQILVHKNRRAVSAWLAMCLLLVAGMVLVGGYTRLSGSGLSITEWKPIHGIVPPIGHSQWEEEFAAYRATPQYHKVNNGMSLDEFKTIYWPEFFHRVLGRLIGFVFLFPLIFFALRRSICKSFAIRLTAIFALGGLQGGVGWFMVASGLIDSPYVSPVRLALHLSIAFAIFALILWALLDTKDNANHSRPSRGYVAWFFLLCLQIILGALVAGAHAGLVYNTWPTMNGDWIPKNLLSDPITLVQFYHRMLAVLVTVFFIIWWYLNRRYVTEKKLAWPARLLAFILALQFALGVLTLVHMVPLPMALAHQMTALALFATATVLLHAQTKTL